MNTKISRQGFLAGLGSLAAAGAFGSGVPKSKDGLVWAMYNQLGSHDNWNQLKNPLAENGHFCGESTLIDDNSWENRMAAASKNGCNMMCIDLMEAYAYDSHPELALKGSRSREWLNKWVRRLRDMGIEAIPAINCSTTHSPWMGFWSRRVSTPEYYKFVADLFAEAYDVFEKPSHMHFGMDEENSDCTARMCYSLRRQDALLWHDINFYAKTISKLGARPWMFSDYEWWRTKEFPEKVSKDILQSNWYYGFDFDLESLKGNSHTYVESYIRLEKAGFDQMPGCSNWVGGHHIKAGRKVNVENIPGTVEFAKRVISKEHLKGFFCMPWLGRSVKSDPMWIDAVEQLAKAREKYFG